MRYIFSQLLELQNELNEEVDYDKIKTIVDEILKLLEIGIQNTPMRKKFIFYGVYSNGSEILFKYLTQSELQLVLDELEALGFNNVTVKSNLDTLLVRNVEITISWE